VLSAEEGGLLVTSEELQRLGEILAGFATTEAEDMRLLQGAILVMTFVLVQLTAVHGVSAGTAHPDTVAVAVLILSQFAESAGHTNWVPNLGEMAKMHACTQEAAGWTGFLAGSH